LNTKIIKIGYQRHILDTFIPHLLQSNKNIDMKIRLLSNTVLETRGNALDKLLDSLIQHLPEFNKSYNIDVQNHLLHLLYSLHDQDSDQDHPIIKTCLINLLKSWSDTYFTRHCTVEHHMSVTRSLVYFTQRINDKLMDKYQCKGLFLKGIDVHIQSTTRHINVHGMILAEIFSTFLQPDNPLKFDHLTIEDKQCLHLDFTPTYRPSSSGDQKDDEGVQTFIKGTDDTAAVAPKMDRKKEIEQRLEKEFSKYDDPDMLVVRDDNDDDDVDDDDVQPDEDIDDDDLKPYNLDDDESDLKGVRKKLYLRDCIVEFQSNKHTADSWESALISIASIVWSRPDDLDELSVSMTRSLLHLTNEYEIDNFEPIRHEALVALAVNSTVLVINYLTDAFFQMTFSLGQRLEILSVLVETAMELSGYKEEKAKQLKEQQQSTIKSMAKHNPLIIDTNTASNSIKDHNENVPIQFVGVTRRWGVSTRPKADIKSNKYHQLAPSFFYPFMTNFNKVTQSHITSYANVNMIGYDCFLLSRLVYTLGVIVECAGNSTHTRGMARELVSFVWPIRFHSDVSVRRSTLFTLSRVFYTLPDDQIKSDYQDEQEELQQWLFGISNEDSDKDCRIMSLGVLSKLMEQQ
ncbi:hypothetical protein SAMD00019534_045980, partial [Acytostelium subglobosum LB1]|uniref:hypothetical protein n=1 Tax=Acytostelium subglobosum LB1 TaxID=1410327 RepID=UPI0006450D31